MDKSALGRYSKRKGYRAEALFVELCEEAGIPARRVNPGNSLGDVELLKTKRLVEIKDRKGRYKSVLDWVEKSEGMVALKIPGKREFVVVLNWDTFVIAFLRRRNNE